MSARRTLYECREEGIVNLREVSWEADGDVVLFVYDLDPALEAFVGDTDFEKELRIRAAAVPRLQRALEEEFGAGPLLELIERGFGGEIGACTKFESWARERRIPMESWSY